MICQSGVRGYLPYLIKKAPWNASYLECFWYRGEKKGVTTSQLTLSNNKILDLYNSSYGSTRTHIGEPVENFNPKKIGYYHTVESSKIAIPENIKKMSLDYDEAKNKVIQLEKDFFQLAESLN